MLAIASETASPNGLNFVEGIHGCPAWGVTKTNQISKFFSKIKKKFKSSFFKIKKKNSHAASS